MTSRERIIKTLNHEQPDRVPIDFGGSTVTGIAAGALDRLRKAIGLEYRPVKVIEPFQVLGKVEEDVLEALGVDVAGIWPPEAMFFGYNQDSWKKWKLMDGTEVHIGSGFEWTKDEQGNVYTYPQGDLTAKPCAKMPCGGCFFDSIPNHEPIDEDNLNAVEDFKEQFPLYTDDQLKYFEKVTNDLYCNTDYALSFNFWATSLGDAGFLPGGSLKNPKGIREISEFLMAFKLYPEYINELFEYQTEMGLKNLKLLKESIGNKIQTIYISGCDMGTQRGMIFSPDIYREFYKSHHTKINKWIHDNTTWKVSFHSCGSIVKVLDDFVEAGVDVINPVQTSAEGMDPKFLKKKYGDKLVFWGGGVDTQSILPFGTPEDVRKDVLERLEIFAPGGGFVFNTIHNIQHDVPAENILAMFSAVKEYNSKMNTDKSEK